MAGISTSLFAWLVHVGFSAVPEPPVKKSIRCEGPWNQSQCSVSTCPKGNSTCIKYHNHDPDYPWCCCPGGDLGSHERLDPWASSGGCTRWGCDTDMAVCGAGCCADSMQCGYNYTVYNNTPQHERHYECCVNPGSTREHQEINQCCAWNVGVDCRTLHQPEPKQCCRVCTPAGKTNTPDGMLTCTEPDDTDHCQYISECHRYKPYKPPSKGFERKLWLRLLVGGIVVVLAVVLALVYLYQRCCRTRKVRCPALIIANYKYEYDSFEDLPQVTNDLRLVRPYLTACGYEPIYMENASYTNMRSLFRELHQKIGGQRLALVPIIYLGHALQHSGVMYLVPTDQDGSDPEYLIREDSVFHEFENAHLPDICEKNHALPIRRCTFLYVFDACRTPPNEAHNEAFGEHLQNNRVEGPREILDQEEASYTISVKACESGSPAYSGPEYGFFLEAFVKCGEEGYKNYPLMDYLVKVQDRVMEETERMPYIQRPVIERGPATNEPFNRLSMDRLPLLPSISADD